MVDQIRVQMWDANQTTLLFETFLSVYFRFTSSSDIVTNISLGPTSPNVLRFSDNVNLSFSYSTRQANGVLIWARPFTNGALTPNYAAHGSPIYTGAGQGSGFFTITSGAVVVDQIRIQMWDANQTTLLFEAFLPVYYRFANSTNIVNGFTFRPANPNVFKYNDNLDVAFSYTTNEATGVRIFIRPFSGASLSPSYAAHPSGVYSTGSGTGSGYFTLTAGPIVVDKVRVQMWNAAQTTLLFEAFLPVNFIWAGAGPPPGPDMHIDAMEVTQAIQDLNNSVDLIANKRTYVRVHVSSPVTANDVYANLSGMRGGMPLAPILSPGNPGNDISVRTSPDRGQINDSFWFELPSSWTAAGSLQLTARLDPTNVKNDTNLANNVKTITVNFLSTPPFRLRLVDVQYTAGGLTYLAANSHLDALESWLRRAYPISQLQVTRQTYIYPTGGLPNVDTLHSYLALIKLFRELFNGEDSRLVYYGVVDDGGGFMRGKAAAIPGTVAAGPSGTGNWGWDFDGSYNDWYGGHEIGHTRGRYHAEFCGAGGGAPYPYPGGRISPALTGNTAAYGFDITTRAIYGPTWNDVMTYCSNQWISDFTYEGIRSYLSGIGKTGAASANMVSASDFLVVSGLADLQADTASLLNVYVISQNATVPLPDPGDWTIALVNASNTDLAAYPFAPDELTDSEGSSGKPAVIAELVPWVAGTVRVEIRHNGKVITTRSTSATPPTVNLTGPADGAVLPVGAFNITWTGSDLDGDLLKYTVLFSNDSGANWQVLATDLSTTQLGANTDQLPGGSVLLRVVATDGLLTGQDTSGAITVPLHAPQASIVTPGNNQVFYATQMVTLQGSAYDLEDGMLGDSAFRWTSDRNGELGTGAMLSTDNLMSGQHVLTLTVTDKDGMTTQVQRTIQVVEDPTQEATNLNVAPFSVGVVATIGDPPTTHTVTIHSSSGTEFNWNASENLPWLQLDATSGTTPSNLVLTVNPAGLPIGAHSGKIAITSRQAGNSPYEINVVLQVVGHGIYLPMVVR